LESGSAPARLTAMNRLEKARYRNILKKAAKVNRLLKKGYLVFDHYGNKAIKFQYCKKQKYLYQGNEQGRVVYAGRKESLWISALDIPIKEYNADRFDKWTAVHPKDIKKI
jgi:hypothetical protein